MGVSVHCTTHPRLSLADYKNSETMTEQLILVLVIFLAVFTQSLSGFGFALVAMAILPSLIDLKEATSLVALAMTTIEVFLLIYYRQALKIGVIWRIVLASLIGIPLGMLFLSRLDQAITMTVLGIAIVVYALYALINAFTNLIHLPKLEHSAWAYASGVIAGILGGLTTHPVHQISSMGTAVVGVLLNLKAIYRVSSSFLVWS